MSEGFEIDQTFGSNAAGRGGTVQPIRHINDIEPLDDGAVDAHCSVALQPYLFDHPSGIDNPVSTYALLDAAKVPNLREMIESSGLENRCIFSGHTFDELADVAPWLVRLEPGHLFVRRLFEKGDAPWELWNRDAGIFLRSSLSIDDLRRHLKKFTKASDGSGQNYFVRFWEPSWTLPLLNTMAAEQAHKFLAPLHSVCCHTGTEAILLAGGAHTAEYRQS